jgi:hypothetical protein
VPALRFSEYKKALGSAEIFNNIALTAMDRNVFTLSPDVLGKYSGSLAKTSCFSA